VSPGLAISNQVYCALANAEASANLGAGHALKKHSSCVLDLGVSEDGAAIGFAFEINTSAQGSHVVYVVLRSAKIEVLRKATGRARAVPLVQNLQAFRYRPNAEHVAGTMGTDDLAVVIANLSMSVTGEVACKHKAAFLRVDAFTKQSIIQRLSPA
jgi:hypothetical protein